MQIQLGDSEKGGGMGDSNEAGDYRVRCRTLGTNSYQCVDDPYCLAVRCSTVKVFWTWLGTAVFYKHILFKRETLKLCGHHLFSNLQTWTNQVTYQSAVTS